MIPVLARTRKAAWERAGHRGLFLFLLGFFDIFYGWYLAAGGALEFPLLIPETAWGIIWLTAGALMIFGAWVKRDAVFFALAAGLKCAWALEFARQQFQHNNLLWTRAAYWLALALIVVAVSAWPEPPVTGPPVTGPPVTGSP